LRYGDDSSAYVSGFVAPSVVRKVNQRMRACTERRVATRCLRDRVLAIVVLI